MTTRTTMLRKQGSESDEADYKGVVYVVNVTRCTDPRKDGREALDHPLHVSYYS